MSSFVLQPGVVPLIILEPHGLDYPKLIEKLKENRKAQVCLCASSSEAISFCKTNGSGVILCFAGKQEDLASQVEILKMLKVEISKNKVKIILLTSFVPEKLFSKLKTYGFCEVYPTSMDQNTLLSKILEQISCLEEFKETPFIVQKMKTEEQKIRMLPPLQLKSDYWLYQSSGTRRVMEQWVIALKGPGPSVGKWEPVSEEKWKWVFQKEAQLFLKDEGAWCFAGEIPKFKDDVWHFVGKKPELIFYDKDGKALATKFLTDFENNLIVTYDSLNAIHLRDEIEATFQKEESPPANLQGDKNQAAQVSDLIQRKVEKAFQSNKKEATPLDLESQKGPEFIKSIKGQGPALGPLAFAFLVSELSCRKEYSLKQIVQRFCDYLQASCGEVNVELWYQAQGNWRCGGTSLHDEGRLGKHLGTLKEGAIRVGNEILLSVIRNEEHPFLGAIILSGKGAIDISPEYLLAVGKMTSGLCMGLIYSTESIDESLKSA